MLFCLSKGDGWTHKTILTRHFLLKGLYQAPSERLCVSGINFASFSCFDIGIVPTLWNFSFVSCHYIIHLIFCVSPVLFVYPHCDLCCLNCVCSWYLYLSLHVFLLNLTPIVSGKKNIPKHYRERYIFSTGQICLP